MLSRNFPSRRITYLFGIIVGLLYNVLDASDHVVMPPAKLYRAQGESSVDYLQVCVPHIASTLYNDFQPFVHSGSNLPDADKTRGMSGMHQYQPRQTSFFNARLLNNRSYQVKSQQ